MKGTHKPPIKVNCFIERAEVKDDAMTIEFRSVMVRVRLTVMEEL
jgi:hypothetical protein